MDLAARLRHLEAGAMILEPGPEQRKQSMETVMETSEKFLKRLEKLETKIFTEASTRASSGILKSPIMDHGSSIGEIMDLYENTMRSDGVISTHGMNMGFVDGGGLYTSAVGEYLSAVTNKYSGTFYKNPEAVRMEHMLVAWAAELCGPSDHAGTLTSGATSGTMIAIATARDSMNIRGRDFEKCVVYVSETTHYCVQRSVQILGMRDAIIRNVPVRGDHMTMDVQSLRKIISKDVEEGLKPFVIGASAGDVLTGSIDPIDQIADVAEEYKVWLHVDAAYGGFFALVDDIKHLFKGIEKSDSVTMDPHKGLFLPYGSGLVVVRDGRKLFNTFSQVKHMTVFQDMPKQHEYSPCDLGFELTRPARGLRMWLPLKLFGQKAFATALEEKLVLAKYFHERITSIEGFVAEPYPQLTVVVFYYDTKNEDMTDKFNTELQKNILADGRSFMSSVTIKGRYHLRICILNFRTHRKHIDFALQIIQESTVLLKDKYKL